jgi:hypothetical protein
MAIASYLAGLGASPGSLVLKTGSYSRPDPKQILDKARVSSG